MNGSLMAVIDAYGLLTHREGYHEAGDRIPQCVKAAREAGGKRKEIRAALARLRELIDMRVSAEGDLSYDCENHHLRYMRETAKKNIPRYDAEIATLLGDAE